MNEEQAEIAKFWDCNRCYASSRPLYRHKKDYLVVISAGIAAVTGASDFYATIQSYALFIDFSRRIYQLLDEKYRSTH